MRFLVDEQLPPALALWIERQGHEAIHVRDVGLRSATDDAIWRFAIEGGYVIVTNDEDFAERRGRQVGPSILRLRLGNSTMRGLQIRMEQIWARFCPGWSGAKRSLRPDLRKVPNSLGLLSVTRAV